ncbi:MAG TPA: hypothetical protein PLV92_13085, partial [Pirellulaceae bacterium]|nr:hypothetical protein [Pirellulaceae bacterium]
APADAPPSESSAAEQAKPSASTHDTAAQRDTAPKERIILLMPGGPRVVDFLVTIGGKRPGESLTEEARRVLSLVDKDEDGRVTWDELTLDERFQRGQFGNQPLNTENERREFIKQRDVNRDKVVNMEEAASLFSRDSMRFQAFSVQDLASAADSVSRGSPLFRILDENEDGVIDEAERNNATARLLTRDADDDEALLSTELAKTAPTDNPRRMAARRRLSAPMHVWHLGPRTDWEGLLLAMQETYSLGGPLTPDVLPDATELFLRLDVNDNKMLSRDELQRLGDGLADLTWQVDFLLGPESPMLKLVGEETSPRRVLDSQWEEDLGGSRVTWLAREATSEPSDAGAKRLIAMYDGDKNGYLSDDETAPALGGLALSMESIDANDDKKLDLEELTAALERRRLAGSSRVKVQLSRSDDPLFAWLDDDGDRRLDARELTAAPSKLAKLKTNVRGELTPDELPALWQVAIACGEVGDRAIAPSPRRPETAADRPAWFVAMDANGDGVISRREFPGETSQFEKLDANGDDGLSWDELRPSR